MNVMGAGLRLTRHYLPIYPAVIMHTEYFPDCERSKSINPSSDVGQNSGRKYLPISSVVVIGQ